ncbi:MULTISPECIES: hypothetical protein [unclassified Haladaptatus]|uniref:hypothetical protein n=1 Tax=unclassified Haladaptatus TaxID=2622732 RepID=UPI0023E7BB76|nr:MULTISPECIES: hypothetical protein [unclassified Haladaptatus]
MSLRERIGALQVPVALLAVMSLVSILGEMHTLVTGPDQGFPGGLALLLAYAIAWVSFVALAFIFAVPTTHPWAIQFSRPQRLLFLTSGIASIASLLLPFSMFTIALALGLSDLSLVGNAWLLAMVVAVGTFVGGLCWRLGEAVWRVARPA